MRGPRIGLRHLMLMCAVLEWFLHAAPEVAAQSPPIGESFLSAFRDSLSVVSLPGGLQPDYPDSCYSKYPDSLATSPFSKVFDLYTSHAITNGVGGQIPGWSAAQLDTFMNAIVDSDSTTYNDAFPRIWNYFCMSDNAAAEDSVNYVVRVGSVDSTFTKLQISLYHSADFEINGPYQCDDRGPSYESQGFGSADGNTVLYGANIWYSAACNSNWSSYMVSPLTAANSGVFAHELQHIADAANHHTSLGNRSEFLSTAAEYLAGSRWGGQRKMSLLNDGLYGQASTRFAPYKLYRFFSAYLFGRFPEDPDDDTDDLVYKLVRYVSPGQSSSNSSLYGMGHVLARDFPDSVDGSDASEKMGNLYHQFALARFADDSTGYAGGIYGFGASGVSPRTFGWFEWTDTCIDRVLWMPPDVTCGSELMGSGPPVTVSTWTDYADTAHANRSRQLTVRSFGSEYFILRADSTIFNQGQTLRVEVSGNDLLPTNEMLKVGYIEYADPTGNLFDQPLRRVVPDVAISSPEWHPSATVEIPSFGDTTKAVVLVISMVQSPLQLGWGAQNDVLDISVSYDLSIDTTRVPSETQYIQTAIDATSAGNVVVVAGKDGTAYHENLAMTSGVRVIGTDIGYGLPVLDADSDTVAVSFPSDATTSTTIENFTIRGGTDAIVHLRGQGRLKNCTLDGRSTDPDYGILADSTAAGSYVENCSVVLDSGTGVSLQGNACDLTGCTIRIDDETSTNTGIETIAMGSPCEFAITGNLVKVPYGTGIDIGTPLTLVTNCTIDSVAVGVSCPTGRVHRCIVSHHTTAGFDGSPFTKSCISSGTGYPYGVDDVAMGEYCVAEDPLYCDAANGEYTLRADSYGAPDNNFYHALIGAFGVACLQDTVVRDMTYSQGAPLPVLGDVVVPTGKTLTLGAGAMLAIASNDDRADLGSDTTRVEIIVDGTLKAEGGLGEEAAFHAAEGGEGTWAGIHVMEDAFIKLDHASIENAVTGVVVDSVYCHGSGSPQNYITNSLFASNQSRDLKIAGKASCGPYTLPLLVEGNTFTVGGGTGIELVEDVSGVTVRGNTFVGSSSSTNGILLGSSSTSPVITENTASGFSNGYPLRIEGGSAEVTKNTFQNSKYGIYVYVNSGVAAPNIGTTNSSSDNFLTTNTNGIRCEKTGAQASIRNNRIHDNTYGVVTRGDANPFLGTAADHGNNSFYSNTTNCIRNLNTNVGLIAGGNWFGDCDEPGCGSGPVLFPDWLCTQPASFGRPGIKIQETKPRFALRGAAPNPMSRSGAIVLELGQPANSVSVEIFDVAGRLVRQIETQNLGQGVHSLPWDGRDANGTLVGSGLYFIRARTEGWDCKTAKMLVVR